HVLGLDIDPRAPDLAAGLSAIRHSRSERAARIAARLDAAGVAGSLQGAARLAGNAAAMGRSHFARFLVEQRHARNISDAFRRYLGMGSAAYVVPSWPAMEQAIGWIHAAGGQSVLAHPDRYHLSAQARHCLFEAFAQSHGDAVEVSRDSGLKHPSQIRLAQALGFSLSSGSDFHAPGKNVADVGDTCPIPAGVPALWQRLRGHA
ncbi:MAG: phosphatase, partial [Bryobacteraceae bacterium]